VVRLAAGLGAKMSGFPSFSFWASQSFFGFCCGGRTDLRPKESGLLSASID
jgi:hypothetical protein